jgi:hypothetical protein
MKDFTENKWKHSLAMQEWEKLGSTEVIKEMAELSVDNSSVGRALSFSHEGPRFKSRFGHLFVSLLICDQIDC